MKPSKKNAFLVTAVLVVLLCSIAIVFTRVRSRASNTSGKLLSTGSDESPRVILWVWERPSDLRFIDPRRVGVAFLAQSILIRGDELVVKPRLQPLEPPPGTKVIAVTRVESSRKDAPRLSSEQRQALASSIAVIAALPHVSRVQIDFDAIRSERSFYRDLILDVRERLPGHVGLSMTALASWCTDDDWLSNLPIDEAVPMLFRMGPDRMQIIRHFSDGKQLSAAPCRNSYGISTDEPLSGLSTGKRLYVFNPRAWNKDSIRAILDSHK